MTECTGMIYNIWLGVMLDMNILAGAMHSDESYNAMFEVKKC